MARRFGVAAGCGLLSLGGLMLGATGCAPSVRLPAAPARFLTPAYRGSELVAVVDGPAAGPSLAQLVGSTARPGEDLDVLAAGAKVTVLAAGISPRPARVVIPARPAPPGQGATDYQRAKSRRALQNWNVAVARAKRAVAAGTRTALAAWARGLGLAAKVGRLPRQAGRSVSLAAEVRAAAGALLRLGDSGGASPGDRRVVVLYAWSLAGRLPLGELSGDDVIVVLPSAPTARAISSAQTRLIAAGAASARIVGPDTTPSQLAGLVSAGLSHRPVTDSLSAAALFGNGRASLAPGAEQVLLPLVARLREPGATAVINGYASTPGRSKANYLLSFARATAVAAFLEVHGVPASALQVVGHGATDLVAPGASAANRRVVVVIEEPASDDGTGR